MNNFYTLGRSFLSKEDKSALTKILKTPLLLIMVPVLFVIMIAGLVTGLFSSIFVRKKPAPQQKRRTE